MGSSNFQNEVRGGFNLAPVQFVSDWVYSGNQYTTALGIINPIGGNGTAIGFQPQGRYTNTYQINDTANLMLGSHQLQMGGSWQRNHVNPYNFAGAFPQVNFGYSAVAPGSLTLTTAQFPGGITAADLGTANAMAAWLGGAVTSVQQTFQVEDHELRIRRRCALGRELHARQHRRLRPGQLALEAELHGACGPQVGVLQPAA